MIDLWQTRDLPVLRHLLQRLEVDGLPTVPLPIEVEGVTPEQVTLSLRHLQAAGYVLTLSGLEGILSVLAITETGLVASGAWP